jgi:type IV fimbrial biogenesis protein FimT
MTAICDGLRLTRDEAIRRNGRVAMCKSADGSQCTKSGDWSQGWIVFHDSNNSGSVDAQESVLYREPPLSGAIRLSGNTPVSNYVSYTSHGKAKLLSDAFQAGHFTVCAPSAKSTDAYLVYIGILGQPRVEKKQVKLCG